MIVENFFKQCSKCLNYEYISKRDQLGTCIRTSKVLHPNTICPCPQCFAEKPSEIKGDKTMVKIGELLPLIKCKFVVEYKGEIYHSFGNTLQSVLRGHFKDLTVKDLYTYDSECLKVVIK